MKPFEYTPEDDADLDKMMVAAASNFCVLTLDELGNLYGYELDFKSPVLGYEMWRVPTRLMRDQPTSPNFCPGCVR